MTTRGRARATLSLPSLRTAAHWLGRVASSWRGSRAVVRPRAVVRSYDNAAPQCHAPHFHATTAAVGRTARRSAAVARQPLGRRQRTERPARAAGRPDAPQPRAQRDRRAAARAHGRRQAAGLPFGRRRGRGGRGLTTQQPPAMIVWWCDRDVAIRPTTSHTCERGGADARATAMTVRMMAVAHTPSAVGRTPLWWWAILLPTRTAVGHPHASLPSDAWAHPTGARPE